MSDVLEVDLPGRYFRLMEAELPAIARRLEEAPEADLKTLEAGPNARHFPGAILAAAVLYAKRHAANPGCGSRDWLALALRIGDLLAAENAAGRFTERLDHHRDTSMWLEAYRLLEGELGEERRVSWRREIERNVAALAADVAGRVDYPRYQSPFIGTSPNHYSLWSSTVYLAGRTFGNREWEDLGARVLHRFAAEEQTADGYWGEHSDAGPTPGYDHLTLAGVAIYAEHSGDPVAIEALRRSTRFHTAFTYPNGMPVEVINDRNRHWFVSAWGHFGFSHFPEGRRYAAFLTERLRERALGPEALGRIAQNALYFHEGPGAPIPQDLPQFAHRMAVPAGIRKRGPWVVCLSGLISTQAVSNQFYLDRQGHVSIFHERLGLIITGANSKRQPELATFRETVAGQGYHLPTSSGLRMEESGDRLGLAYNGFFADIEICVSEQSGVSLRATLLRRGRLEEGAMTLQLCLKPGEVLETARSRVVVGEERIDLGPEEVGGRIRHRGWTLEVDPSARLTWPVYPFNPYANGPETSLERAVAALSIPLSPTLPPDGVISLECRAA